MERSAALLGLQSSVAHSPTKVGPVDKLHEEIKDRAVLAEVVNSDDAGVAELGEGPRFASETLGESRILTEFGRQHLEGDEAVEPDLPGLVDHTHAALAQDFENFQVRKMGASSDGLSGAEAGPEECAVVVPGAAIGPDPPRIAPFRRQCGQSPSGASTGRPDPHPGHRRVSGIGTPPDTWPFRSQLLLSLFLGKVTTSQEKSRYAVDSGVSVPGYLVREQDDGRSGRRRKPDSHRACPDR